MGDIIGSDYDQELCKIYKIKELEQIKKSKTLNFKPISNVKRRSNDGIIKHYNLPKINLN